MTYAAWILWGICMDITIVLTCWAVVQVIA
jgi:hypothetical protein